MYKLGKECRYLDTSPELLSHSRRGTIWRRVLTNRRPSSVPLPPNLCKATLNSKEVLLSTWMDVFIWSPPLLFIVWCHGLLDCRMKPVPPCTAFGIE